MCLKIGHQEPQPFQFKLNSRSRVQKLGVLSDRVIIFSPYTPQTKKLQLWKPLELLNLFTIADNCRWSTFRSLLKSSTLEKDFRTTPYRSETKPYSQRQPLSKKCMYSKVGAVWKSWPVIFCKYMYYLRPYAREHHFNLLNNLTFRLSVSLFLAREFVCVIIRARVVLRRNDVDLMTFRQRERKSSSGSSGELLSVKCSKSGSRRQIG